MGMKKGDEVAIKIIDKNKVQLIQSTRNCNLMDEVHSDTCHQPLTA